MAGGPHSTGLVRWQEAFQKRGPEIKLVSYFGSSRPESRVSISRHNILRLQDKSIYLRALEEYTQYIIKRKLGTFYAASMTRPTPRKVQLLSVPDCPLVKKVQVMVEKCLVQTQMDVGVEEIVGNYNSPTLLVDGFDVTGRPAAPEGQTSCRLDLPSEEQILSALLGMAVLRWEDAHEQLVRATTFRTLFRTGQHVAIDDLATLTNLDKSTITRCIDRLRQVGQITQNSTGFIDGAAGLSLAPTRHEVWINGRRFWAWCAFDVLGIFGALSASGFAKSSDPSCGESIEFQFIDGIPQDMSCTIFMANLFNETSVCCDWCPRINFFISRSSAEEWVRENAATGSVISVENVIHVAREAWSRLLIT